MQAAHCAQLLDFAPLLLLLGHGAGNSKSVHRARHKVVNCDQLLKQTLLSGGRGSWCAAFEFRGTPSAGLTATPAKFKKKFVR